MSIYINMDDRIRIWTYSNSRIIGWWIVTTGMITALPLILFASILSVLSSMLLLLLLLLHFLQERLFCVNGVVVQNNVITAIIVIIIFIVVKVLLRSRIYYLSLISIINYYNDD